MIPGADPGFSIGGTNSVGGRRCPTRAVLWQKCMRKQKNLILLRDGECLRGNYVIAELLQLGLENLEKIESSFQSEKSDGSLLRLEKSGNFVQNTGIRKNCTEKLKKILEK